MGKIAKIKVTYTKRVEVVLDYPDIKVDDLKETEVKTLIPDQDGEIEIEDVVEIDNGKEFCLFWWED